MNNINNTSQIKAKTIDSKIAAAAFVLSYLFTRAVPVRENPLGGFLLTLLAYSVLTVFIKIKGAKIGPLPLLAGLSAVILSATLPLSGSPFIQGLGFFYSVITLLYYIYSAFGNSIKGGFNSLIIFDYLKALFILPFLSIGKFFKSLFSGENNSAGKTILKILIGIFLTIIPSIVIVLILGYDKGFIKLLEKIFDFDFNIFSHIGSLILAIPLGAYLFGLISSAEEQKGKNIITAEAVYSADKKIKLVPALTIFSALIPIIFIYVVFFISQWDFYVSGFTGVLPKGFSLSEYAREGFFQLCWVTAINLGLISGVLLLTKQKNEKTPVLIKILNITFSLVTLILIATALSKMALYIKFLGLTPKRVYASFLMIIFAVIFIIIILKQFIKKLPSFILSLTAALILFMGLSAMDVNSVIAHYNVKQYISGNFDKIDYVALNDLGISAVPAMVELKEHFKENDETYDLSTRLSINAYLNAYQKEIKENEKSILEYNLPYLRAKKALKKAGYEIN